MSKCVSIGTLSITISRGLASISVLSSVWLGRYCRGRRSVLLIGAVVIVVIILCSVQSGHTDKRDEGRKGPGSVGVVGEELGLVVEVSRYRVKVMSIVLTFGCSSCFTC